MGSADSDSALRMRVQSDWYCPKSSDTPRMTVRWSSARIKMSGNQRSFQIGIRLKMITVASAGRTSLPGVYELAHPVAGEEWFLRAVVD